MVREQDNKCWHINTVFSSWLNKAKKNVFSLLHQMQLLLQIRELNNLGLLQMWHFILLLFHVNCNCDCIRLHPGWTYMTGHFFTALSGKWENLGATECYTAQGVRNVLRLVENTFSMSNMMTLKMIMGYLPTTQVL